MRNFFTKLNYMKDKFPDFPTGIVKLTGDRVAIRPFHVMSNEEEKGIDMLLPNGKIAGFLVVQIQIMTCTWNGQKSFLLLLRRNSDDDIHLGFSLCSIASYLFYSFPQRVICLLPFVGSELFLFNLQFLCSDQQYLDFVKNTRISTEIAS